MRPPRQITEARFDAAAHQPDRPSWLCLGHVGEEPWPCAGYREHVLETYSGLDRGIHMAGYFQQAVVELRVNIAGEIWERFLGWTRSRTEAEQVRGRPPGGLF